MSERKVFVFIELDASLHLVGQLWARSSRGKEGASFQYDQSWLNFTERFALEPAIQLTSGVHHTGVNHSLFGSIGDSAPDRWGRVLMRRAAARTARALNKQPTTLTEVDYLLGVYDEARQGALRFSDRLEGPFLEHTHSTPIPPLIELPKLLSATENLLEDKESDEDFRLLLAPGSSLGGARPKASVRDKDGQLAIAKFPHKEDEYSTVLWEALALKLAGKAGIKVPEWRIEIIAKKPVLIVRRFDRDLNKRIPFLSAMSMIGAVDNEEHSYLEIADALSRYGAHPNQDRVELWKRIVFSILISNTDDHLRNHGFLYLKSKGWVLSPLYDVNPTPIQIKPRILTTAIDLYDNTASLELALVVSKEFGVDENLAAQIIKEVGESVKTWKKEAKNLRINDAEITRMTSAFEHRDFEFAMKY